MKKFLEKWLTSSIKYSTMYQFEKCFEQEIMALSIEFEKTANLDDARVLWQVQSQFNKSVDAILLKPQYLQAREYYKTISHDYINDFADRYTAPVRRL